MNTEALLDLPASPPTPAPAQRMPRNGAEALLDTLVACGVDTLFGYPGGAALPLYDALHGEPRLRHVLVRHEQAAVHAAEGYARSTGRVGVVLVTSTCNSSVKPNSNAAATAPPGRQRPKITAARAIKPLPDETFEVNAPEPPMVSAAPASPAISPAISTLR